MAGWYGHTITVEVQDGFKFPKFDGRLSFLNSITDYETRRVSRKLNKAGEEILGELALRSQFAQRDIITELGAVDTGRLRDSIQISTSGLTANIGTSLFYAETVHDIGYKNQTIFNINGIIVRGHSDIGPRPWVEKSFELLEEKVDGVVNASLNKIR